MRSNVKHIDGEIKQLLKQFKLPDILERYDNEIEKAASENISHRELLHRLLKVEAQGKHRRLVEKNIKNARFEGYKTIEEFEFSFPKSINVDKIKDLATLGFIEKKENVIFLGPPGVGKSHLSTALGIKACEQGKKVLYVNATDFMDELGDAYNAGTLKLEFKKLSKFELILIDDLGYLKLNKEKESIFYQLVRQRYEKSSLMISTNLPFNRWDEIFTSEVAATAVLDRLLHRHTLISITGDSYRVKNKLQGGT